jgi:hypothetical protein
MDITKNMIKKMEENNDINISELIECDYQAAHLLARMIRKLPRIPEKYKPLYEALNQLIGRDVALTFYAIEEHERNRTQRIELNNRILALSEKHWKKWYTKEKFYNKICNRFPDYTYKEIHQYFKDRGDIKNITLRKYKERRIKNTNDFRETMPITKNDVKKVVTIFRKNNYRLPYEEISMQSGFEKDKLDMVLEKMKKQGHIAYTKDRKDGILRDVLVLTD